MFSEVKQQLVELKEEIKQIKANQTGRPCIKGLLQTCALQFFSLGFSINYQSVMTEKISAMDKDRVSGFVCYLVTKKKTSSCHQT